MVGIHRNIKRSISFFVCKLLLWHTFCARSCGSFSLIFHVIISFIAIYYLCIRISPCIYAYALVLILLFIGILSRIKCI